MKRGGLIVQVGDVVEGGETAEDKDTGRVVEIDGDKVTVAWESGVRTTQPAHLLRIDGVRCATRAKGGA